MMSRLPIASNRLQAIRRRLRSLPRGPGVYFMKGAGEKVLYIGKAGNLRSRVAGYFQPAGDIGQTRGPKIAEMLSRVVDVDFLETGNEVDAMLKEARLIKDIRPPYNTELTDDKTFPYLEITTGDDFPGVYITRRPRSEGSRLFGPFAGAKELRGVLVEMQKIFRFRTCTLEIGENNPNRRFFRPCILYSIKQCSGPCAAKIEKSEYHNIVTDLLKFLRSKRSTVIRRLKRQMLTASEARQYEKAAVYRNRIRLIERLDRRGSPERDVQPEVFAAEPTQALAGLQKLLGAAQPVRIIEGIDAAHIAGSEAVGSLVKFIDARPFRSGYRRFRIKSVAGIDDYAMIAEVVRRRYRYAVRGEEIWPDLVLIDGGIGQLHAAEKALREMDAPIPNIVSLAKQQEEIFLQGRAQPVRLSANSPVLKLLQYVRDEAHRFAQHYHHLLRSKRMLSGKQ